MLRPLRPRRLIIRVNQPGERRPVAPDDDNCLVDPAAQIGDVGAVGPAEGVDDVDEVWREVARHVHEAGGRGEGHGHGGVVDEAQGLGVERVPEEGVAGAGAEGGRVDLVVRLGVDRGKLVGGGAGGRADG